MAFATSATATSTGELSDGYANAVVRSFDCLLAHVSKMFLSLFLRISGVPCGTVDEIADSNTGPREFMRP
jgi:hypothetical protein